MRLLPRFELSGTQLIATALAAVTATVAASYLGVAGTVIGAAVGSVLSAIGTAVYSHSLRRTHARVREVVPAARRRAAPVPNTTPTSTPSKSPRQGHSDFASVKAEKQGRWHGVAIGSLAVFVAVLAVVTGTELVTGRPLSDLLRGTPASGTTIFGSTKDAAAQAPAPAPTVTQTVTPSVVVTTPTITETAPPVTETATPSAPPTPATTPTPTPTPTVSVTTPGASGQPTP
jgi:hypothetical protein